MALDHLSSDNYYLEEDYIDMEVNSYSNLFSKTSIIRASSSSSPPQNPREFEFQMSSTAREKDHPTASPADELFYKGKLLPLHLPPRLQMVEKLLESSDTFSSSFDHLNYGNESAFDHEFFSTPLTTTAPTPTATSTPFESCNISPSESFRVSREISPEEYMFEYSTTTEMLSGLDSDEEITSKKSLARKIKHSSIGSKLKASRAYLKSLFGKSSCSDESSTAARKVSDEVLEMKHVKASKKNSPFGQIQRNQRCQTPKNKETTVEACQGGAGRHHRRSFSLSMRRNSKTTTTTTTTANKSSSLSSSSSSSSSGSSSFSSSSNNSNGHVRDHVKYFKRCGSTNYSEPECSIQGAIAHCKQSQQIFSSRSSVSGSRIGVCKEQDREELYRG